MRNRDWSRSELEAIVDDYLDMLARELAGVRYSKAAHRRALQPRLQDRSEQAIEFKYCNISAALIDAGYPYLAGYRPRYHYQALLNDVVTERLAANTELQDLAAADADRPMVMPEVDDVLAVKRDPPHLNVSPPSRPGLARLQSMPRVGGVDYLEREAANRSLGAAGEQFVLRYEQERLTRLGCEQLAARIEHTARVRGDHEGYDILSFEPSGEERLIEVKTTKYGDHTPFYVTRHEVETSSRHAAHYHVYRLYEFGRAPRLYILTGAIRQTCQLSAVSFLAWPR